MPDPVPPSTDPPTPSSDRIRRRLRHLRKLARRVAGWELVTLALVAVVLLGLWGFVELVDEVFEGDTEALDRRLLLALRVEGDPSDPLGPTWFEEVGRDVTAFGGIAVLGFVTLFSAGLVYLQGKVRAALYLLVAVGSGLLASLALKQIFDRPRPDLVPHGSIVHTASFPSGHSMLSAVTYLTLAAVFLRTQPLRRLQAYLLTAATLLTLAVGASRVYLGVHWPTDVLAGWAAGAVWACLAWIVARWLQLLGGVESRAPGEDDPPQVRWKSR